MKTKILILTIFAILISINLVYAIIIWSDDTPTNFETTANNPVCENNNAWVIWQDSQKVSTSSLEDCFRGDGYPSTTCCPENIECILDTESDNFEKCQGLPAPQLCFDYDLTRYNGNESLTEAQCEGFNEEVAKRTCELINPDNPNLCTNNYGDADFIPGRGICWKPIYNSSCVWDNTNKACDFKWTQLNMTCTDDEIITELGDCTITKIRETNCTSGFKFIEWAALWTPDVEECSDDDSNPDNDCVCKDGSGRVKCFSSELSFFSLISLIIAILLIVIFYILYSKKARKKKKR